MTRSPAYVLRIGAHEAKMNSAEELDRSLAELGTRSFADFRLVQRGEAKHGFEKVLYQALGLETASDGPSVYVLTAPRGAAVVFLDTDFNERRVVQEDGPNASEDHVEFRLSNGQHTSLPAAEVIAKDTAMDAVRHFFTNGSAPPTLRYRSSVRDDS